MLCHITYICAMYYIMFLIKLRKFRHIINWLNPNYVSYKNATCE